MFKKNTPPLYGLSSGPIIVACQWNRSSPTGPAEQFVGGSLLRSFSSLLMRFSAIFTVCRNTVKYSRKEKDIFSKRPVKIRKASGLEEGEARGRSDRFAVSLHPKDCQKTHETDSKEV